jgi:hypothetical protein
MRVSNLHHETAIKTLFYLQEIEQDTWERLANRLQGVNSAKHLREDFIAPSTLPFMFSGWREYRDFLLEKMIEDPKNKATFAKQFKSDDGRFGGSPVEQKMYRMHISAILCNDWHDAKRGSFRANNRRHSKNAGTRRVATYD